MSTDQAIAATEQPEQAHERNIRLCSNVTHGSWIKAEDTPAPDDTEKPESGSKRHIQSLLMDCLTSTNLLVLSGLGTSLCVEGAPGMWHLWQAVKDVDGIDIDKVMKLVHYAPPENQENIEVLLSKCKVALDFWPNETDAEGKHVQEGFIDVKNFVEAAEKVITEKCSFVKTGDELPAHSNFLRKIARRSSRKPRTRIFTTNYDLCFETAASNSRFVVVDGFSHATKQTYDPIYFGYDIVRREQSGDTPDFIESVFHLYKLHGSIDWDRQKGEIARNEKPENPLLIYPRSSKYQQAFEVPYIDMMAAFQASIRQPETALIIIGFGFNDDHISGPIMSALQSNMNLKVVVIDPVFYENDSGDHALKDPTLKNEKHKNLAKLIQEGDSRVSLISASFEELADLLPDLVAETDRERHAERFRKIREFEDGK